MRTITLILLTVLAMVSKLASSNMSFNFPSFNSTTIGIELENNASLFRDTLALTKPEGKNNLYWNYGRASYDKPVQLWDPRTDEQADFATHFVFSIREIGNESADGMTFFLSPFNVKIKRDSSGEKLGLFPRDLSEFTFVAVEFDTHQNLFDPSPQHVGIDLNSVKSSTYVTWINGSMTDGRLANAWVRYNSTFHNLSVYLTYDQNPVFSEKYLILSGEVNLRLYLPDRVRVGFTASTGMYRETHTVYSWSFNSSLDLIGEAENGLNEGVQVPVDGHEENGINRLVLGLASGFGFLIIFGTGVVRLVCWRRNSGEESVTKEEEFDVSIDEDFERGMGFKRFTYQELRLATGDFSEERKLGEGGFGEVFKGFLCEDNTEVAVKRIFKRSNHGKKEFVSEVTVISRLRHRNLVKLIGWCHTKGEFLLVFEFMPNGSLDIHLFKSKQTLNWQVRNRIARGLASALLYLHEEWDQYVVHRDIKSSNVLLDSNFNAKLGDFGLARFSDHDTSLQKTNLAGTMGYIAPECVLTGKASKESDVYSFGMVALEICCGRRALETNEDPNKASILEWAWDLYGKGKVFEAVDARLRMEFDEQEVERLMVVGLWCCHPEPSSRPSVKHVLSVLNFEAPLPNLPSELPRPMYLAPSMHSDSHVVDLSKSDKSI